MMEMRTNREGTPRMRRRLVRGVVCLVLGAVTTVGVAWWMPEFNRGSSINVIASHGSQSVSVMIATSALADASLVSVGCGELYSESRTKVFGSESREIAEASAAILPVDDLSSLPLIAALPEWTVLPPMPQEPTAPATLEGTTAITERRGWPLRAVMRQEVYRYRRVNRTIQKAPLREAGHAAVGSWTFPAQPIFPGIVADSVLYAVPWWIVCITPGALKRSRRRRRGRCIGCGYDLAGLAVEDSVRTCPECGAIDRSAAKA